MSSGASEEAAGAVCCDGVAAQQEPIGIVSPAADGYCSTNEEADPWFQMRLDANALVWEVVITNVLIDPAIAREASVVGSMVPIPTGAKSAARLDPVEVWVSARNASETDFSNSANGLCGTAEIATYTELQVLAMSEDELQEANAPVSVRCGRQGRYVIVRAPSSDSQPERQLHMQEVEVRGVQPAAPPSSPPFQPPHPPRPPPSTPPPTPPPSNPKKRSADEKEQDATVHNSDSTVLIVVGAALAVGILILGSVFAQNEMREMKEHRLHGPSDPVVAVGQHANTPASTPLLAFRERDGPTRTSYWFSGPASEL